MATWGFLTNHAVVLLHLAGHSNSTLREISNAPRPVRRAIDRGVVHDDDRPVDSPTNVELHLVRTERNGLTERRQRVLRRAGGSAAMRGHTACRESAASSHGRESMANSRAAPECRR